MTVDPNEIVETFARNWDGVTPYARATVVHTDGATAAKAGAKAIVTFDGELIGWIGGGCLRGAVLRAARQAMDTAKPRLIRVRPKEQISAPRDPDGVELHASGCPGKGKADVFIEPVMPKPPLIIIGTSHIARALTELAAGLSVELVLVGDAEDAPLSVLRQRPGLERGFIVIATQGTRDYAALTGALATKAPYVAFISSRAKGKAMRDRLAADGVSEASLARLRAPAGLDIGARTPAEIAISILAEIISLRQAGPKDGRA
jgi:xanthine dehydrogenase accessory factor